MIIREYQYEKDRPWNCQERFIRIDSREDAWEYYKDSLFAKNNLNNCMTMAGRFEIAFTKEEKDYKALSLEFYMGGHMFIHVASDWTKQFDREPIVVNLKEKIND